MGTSVNQRIKIPFKEQEINKIRNFLKISKMDGSDLILKTKNPIPDLFK
jgi:hypothetical protein